MKHILLELSIKVSSKMVKKLPICSALELVRAVLCPAYHNSTSTCFNKPTQNICFGLQPTDLVIETNFYYEKILLMSQCLNIMEINNTYLYLD